MNPLQSENFHIPKVNHPQKVNCLHSKSIDHIYIINLEPAAWKWKKGLFWEKSRRDDEYTELYKM